MSRCRACDIILDEFELTKKDINGQFLDLCSVCLTASANAGVDTETVDYYRYEILTYDEECDTLY